MVSHDLSPTLHVSNSRYVDLLVHAYVTYVRPIVEHDSVVWSHYTVKDIDNIESVQRPFTKRLPGFGALTYAERLRHLDIPSLELRCFHADLLICRSVTSLRCPLFQPLGAHLQAV